MKIPKFCPLGISNERLLITLNKAKLCRLVIHFTTKPAKMAPTEFWNNKPGTHIF